MKKRNSKTEIGIIGYIYDPEEEAKMKKLYLKMINQAYKEYEELIKSKIPEDDDLFQYDIKKGFTRKK